MLGFGPQPGYNISACGTVESSSAEVCPQLGTEILEVQVTETPDVFLACSVGCIGLVEISNGLGGQVRGYALGSQLSLNEERAAWPMAVSALLPEVSEF